LKIIQGSRVVVLSSYAHTYTPKEGIRLDDINFNRVEEYDAWKSYGQSKLANLLFVREGDRRFKSIGRKVGFFAVHPGMVNTDLTRHSKISAVVFSLIAKKVYKKMCCFFPFLSIFK
jgi:retinol dehydrogenase-12